MTLLYRQTPTWYITGTESTSDTDSENAGCETTESESVEDDESEDDGILRDSHRLNDNSHRPNNKFIIIKSMETAH